MTATTQSSTGSFFVLTVSSTGALRHTYRNCFKTRAAAEFEASQSNKLMNAYRAQGWDSTYKVFSAEELNALMACGTLIGGTF